MYGIIKTLLRQEYNLEDAVLIESHFEEGTRLGPYCENRNVILGPPVSYQPANSLIEYPVAAITPNKFVVATEKNGHYNGKRCKEDDEITNKFILESVHSLKSVNIAVFKRTQRQSLKVVFNEMVTRYFELGITMPSRQIFWKLWCRHIKEINTGSPIWPYEPAKLSETKLRNTQRWTDKYLYLGSKRHAEDEMRPAPIPGLGQTEDKLSYLKPQYFGSWDQAEHSVMQCWEEGQAAMPDRDYEALTFTDDPNSNITYTSLMTTLGIIGQF